MNYASLKAAIQAVIKQNGNEEITGDLLQQSLLAMINALGVGYQFVGVATPATNPTIGDEKIMYIAVDSGTYSNFVTPAVTLDGSQIAIFLYSTSWSAILLNVPNGAYIATELAKKVDKVAGKGLSSNDLTNELVSLINGAIQQSNIAQELGNDAAKVISQKAITDALVNYAKIDGYYASLIAGAAANLLGHGSVPASFLLRTAGGTADIGTGAARFSMFKGLSIVWNQLIPIKSSDASITQNNVTITDNRDGSYTIQTTAEGASARTTLNIAQFAAGLLTGHKVAILGISGGNVGNSYSIRDAQGGAVNTGDADVRTINSSDNILFGISVASGAIITNPVTVRPQLIDLTLANLASSVNNYAEFAALYWLNYYKANAGQILPFAGQTFETTGFNLFNPTTGKAALLGGQTNGYQITGAFTALSFTGVSGTTSTITPDANGKFNVTENGELTVTGGNDSTTCVHLVWSGYRNGEYEPHELNQYAINPASWLDTDGNLIFPYGGMHGAGTAFDFAKPDSDGYVRKATRVMKEIDLGSLSWTKTQIGSTGYYRFISNAISDVAAPASNSIKVNGICGKYIVITADDSYSRVNGLATHTNKTLMVYDESLQTKTAEEFAELINGVKFVYQLSTPVEKTLQTPVSALFMVNDFGTEAWKPDNTDEPYTAPCNVEIAYAMNAVDTLRRLSENYISADSFDNFLALLGTQMNGTYTRTYNPATMKHEFTFTPNE